MSGSLNKLLDVATATGAGLGFLKKNRNSTIQIFGDTITSFSVNIEVSLDKVNWVIHSTITTVGIIEVITSAIHIRANLTALVATSLTVLEHSHD